MSTQHTIFVEIENYIRDLITKNSGVFERNYIMMQSNEWMQKFPVEFNSILNFIESEERNDEMMDDSTPSVAFGSRFDDKPSSVAFGSRFDDDSPSVAFGSRFDDDSPSVAYHGDYADDFPKDPISSVDYSPKADSMGSDYSPCGNQDDEESDIPLQRTMSCAP
jgi:hypothetical protein